MQDLGREHHRRFGVPLAGALDRYAIRVANLLAGNPEGHAALEFVGIGPTVEFSAELVIALCGGEFEAALDGESVRGWRPVRVRHGSVLVIRGARRGFRGYLAVSGGIDVPPVLGSRSTYLRGGFGGYEGRALHTGDQLPIGKLAPLARRVIALLGEKRARFSVDVRAEYSTDPRRATLRAVRGAHGAQAPDYMAAFFDTEFQVLPESDRMGYRLAGGPGGGAFSGELVSEPVFPGTVQQTPTGGPIVLLADAQTTGGYARVAHVARVDLPILAQASPGAILRFREITADESGALLRRRERELLRLRHVLDLQRT